MVRVHDSVAAEKAKKKSDQVRLDVREEAFTSYFKNAWCWDIRPVQARVQSVRARPCRWIPGTLVGLLDGTGVVRRHWCRDAAFFERACFVSGRPSRPPGTSTGIHGAVPCRRNKLKLWTARPTASAAE